MALDEPKTDEKIRLVDSGEGRPAAEGEPAAFEANTEVGVRKGMKVDEFVIEELIGRGGSSEVYRAHDTRTDTTVALKFILQSRLSDKQACARLRSEAKHIMSLRHRNIVCVLDVREHESAGPYLVMELLDGKPLTDFLPLPQKEGLEVCAQVAEALSYAHGLGMIHRDIKPSNVMMLSDGSIRLVDFGLARVFAPENPEHIPLTRTSEVVGTPLYMSPEQCFGQEVNVTTDVYQLGCLLFQSITGFPPFGGSTSFEAMYKHVSAQPDLRSMPPSIREIVSKALDKNPSARFQSAGEMGQCLRDAMLGRNTVRRNSKTTRAWSVVLGCSAVVCVCTLIGLVMSFQGMNPPQISGPALTGTQLQARNFYEQGVEYKARGWTEKSRESLLRAIELDKGTIGFKALSFLRAKLPAHVQSLDAEQANILAYNLRYSGRKLEAEKEWKKCIARYPNFEWPYSNLAGYYLDEGRPADALPLLEKALEINSYYTNGLSNMSETQLQLGHKDLAIKYMKLAAESAPEDDSYREAVHKLERQR
ncbi:MAG: protein kinase [Candidatus Obscuribacterales bacterium]|nr:protein kinase [Candidatus Obscuribacterales bacterium]